MSAVPKPLGKRFSGHLGIKFPDAAHTKWYPLSADTAALVRNRMALGGGYGWMIVETLNNRILAFDPKQVQRIWFLDDAGDAPEDDFKWETTMDDYAGISGELYQLMAAWTDGDGEFEHMGSSAERTAALDLIEQGGFSNRPEELAALLRHTVIHFVDGTRASYEADRQNLVDLVIEFENDPVSSIVEISASEGAFESYFPLNMLRMIEVPTIELDAARSELEVQN